MTDVIKNLNLDNPSDELKNEAIHDAARDSVAAMDQTGVVASVVVTLAFNLHRRLGIIAQELVKDFNGIKAVDDAVNDMTVAAACYALGNAIVAYSANKAARDAKSPVESFLALATGMQMREASTELGRLLGEDVYSAMQDLASGKFDQVGIARGKSVQSFIMSGKRKK